MLQTDILAPENHWRKDGRSSETRFEKKLDQTIQPSVVTPEQTYNVSSLKLTIDQLTASTFAPSLFLLSEHYYGTHLWPAPNLWKTFAAGR